MALILLSVYGLGMAAVGPFKESALLTVVTIVQL